MPDLNLAVFGAVTGLLIGLTGVGGGAVLTPLLVLVGIRPSVAIGTDLAFAAITKLVGTIGHLRSATVDLHLTLALALGSVPASVLGSFVASYLAASYGEAIVREALGAMLLLAALSTLLRLLGVHWGRLALSMTFAPALGALVGFLVGATSVGAGSLLMALLALVFSVPVRKMVGTDVAHGAVLAVAAAAAHGWIGNVDGKLLGSLLVGAVPGVVLGTWLCGRIPERPLRLGIALALALAGLRLV